MHRKNERDSDAAPISNSSSSVMQSQIKEVGFDLFGVLPIGPSKTYPAFTRWLDAGMHGTMDWIAKPESSAKREHPQEILPNAQTILVLAFQYTPDDIPDELLNDPSRGIIARYALYDDYHNVIKKKLGDLAQRLQEVYGVFDWKAYVDTGPFLEREWAESAGMGFTGRNSNLIHYNLGSYLFLSEMLISIPLPVMQQRKIGSCGSCTNCVTECPTGAIIDDRTIDARKCISYITIEYKGSIPEWIRPLMKNRIYGCDICQEVCPWNRKPKAQQKKDFQVRADLVAPKLSTLLFFDDESYRERFSKSPIKRAKREGFMRNVAVALGNWKSDESRQLIEIILKKDPSSLVREHAEWALKQIQ